MKQIMLFLDGTGNLGKEGAPDNTNVFKLYQQVKHETRLAEYIEGVGTESTPKRDPLVSRLCAGATNHCDRLLGRGASDRVRRAYAYLARHYDRTGPTQIFLFGFSRGAFITRMLAGFVHRVGLLFAHPDLEDQVADTFAWYCEDRGGEEFERRVQEIEAVFGRDDGITTHFLGQWDEVRALDVLGKPAKTEASLFKAAVREHAALLPDWIKNARHALALHEVRQDFEPTLWPGVTNETDQTLRQVWFAGAHADVGGGYADENDAGSRYSDIALHWMWQEAKALGLPASSAPQWKQTRHSDIPHIPQWYKFGFKFADLRSVLASMVSRDNDWEALHDSVVDRLEMPIDAAYNQIVDRVTMLWRQADEIVMRKHIARYFVDASTGVVSPAGIKQARNDFEKFLRNEISASATGLEHMLKVMVGFDYVPQLFEDPLNPAAYDPAVIAVLATALDRVEKSMHTASGPATSSDRRQKLRAMILHLSLGIVIPTGTPRIIVKKHKL